MRAGVFPGLQTDYRLLICTTNITERLCMVFLVLKSPF
jgi:hypothetical protein